MITHASSRIETDLPLCGTRESTYVTMKLEDVTCPGCLFLLNVEQNLSETSARPLIPPQDAAH